MKRSTLLRLALVNAVGFSASTVMPLWLGGLAAQFGMPAWFAGLAVVAQLGGAAAFNLAAPMLFPRAPLAPLARGALLVAAAAYLLGAAASAPLFILACLASGGAIGVALNVTNRLMGSAEHVQRGYAVFVLIEVCYATMLFILGGALIARFGLPALFCVLGVTALLGFVLLHRLPIEAGMPVRAGWSRPPEERNRAALALGGFALFFTGQASLNSFMPGIGAAIGLDLETASRTIGLGMPFGFAGAMLARLVGERIPPRIAVILVAALLALAALLLAYALVFPIFVAVVVTLSLTTIFVVPYFFAALGALDRSGRYTGFGPAMMLLGIATGPSIAVLLDARFGLAAVGAFAAVLLMAGGGLFWIAMRARPTTRNRVAASRAGSCTADGDE